MKTFIIPLIGAILMFFLALFILFKNKKKSLNLIFSLVCLSIAIWLFGTSMMFLNVGKKDLAIFWDRICYIGVVFIPTLMYHFSVIFSGAKKQKKLVVLGYFLSFIFLFLIPSDYFVSDLFVYKWGAHTEARLLHHIFLIFFSIYIFLFYFNIYQCYKKSSGFKKAQAKYIFLAFAVMLLGALAYLPAYRIPIHPIFSYPAELIGALIITYAIIRHRLMDIHVVLGRGTIYIFSFFIIIGLAFLLIFLKEKFFPYLSFNISASLIIVISVLLFQPVFKFFEKFASKYFYYTFYSYQKVLTELGKKLTQVLELEELSSLIVMTLVETMKLDRAVILLKDEKGNYQVKKNIGFKEENGISLVRNNFLTNFLEKTQKPLVAEEISLILQETDKKEEREKLEKLRSDMKRIEATVCLPLLIEEKIIGLIILGNKISQESYTEQDINLLINLSNQASIALANAKLYQKVKDLSKNLEKRVKEQVKHIEELSQMKTEFLRIVNHQLRTPTSIIKSMLSVLIDGTIKGEEIKEYLNKIYNSAERLERILDDLLTAQELVGTKPILNYSLCNLEEIISKVIEEFSISAQQKGLSIVFEKDKTLPLVLLDKSIIEKVLKRLIDNAILYTKKGGVFIKTKIIKEDEKKFIQIIVEDTGIGITEEDKNRLFKIFSRGKEAEKIHPHGSGLGLYIVYEYIKTHQGKIEVESKGKDKGTTFIITLPFITEV